jgi:hypothetical protein
MFGFGKWRGGVALISGKGHGGYGWDFPNGIREMVSLWEISRNDPDDVKKRESRIEVILAMSLAVAREKPDIDAQTIPAHEWAMTAFIYSIGRMNDFQGVVEAIGVAEIYAQRHDQLVALDRSKQMALDLLAGAKKSA